MVASVTMPPSVTTFVVANAVALRALEVAGKRLLTRNQRGTVVGVQPELLHTRLKVEGPEHAGKLLAGAWDHLTSLSMHMGIEDADVTALRNTLDGYCTQRLLSAKPHDPIVLRDEMLQRGLLDVPVG
jgi:hypothetical protein